MCRHLFLLIQLLLFSAALPHDSFAQACFKPLQKLLKPRQDTSVELELMLDRRVMDSFITTKDGTLSPFLENPSLKAQKKIETWIAKKFPKKSADKILWEKLTFEQKIEILKLASTERNFWESRRIPELKVKDQVEISFFAPITFLGKRYPAGKHKIKLADVLQDKVEFGSESSVKDLDMIELHFRRPDSSGAVSKDAWTLLRGLYIPKNHQHVHITAPIPIRALRTNPKKEAARLTDYYRRINLLADLYGLLHGAELKSSVYKSGADEVEVFGHLSRENITGVQNYFEALGRGENPEITDSYKIAYIGFRGKDTYDTPNLWGIEYRAIHPGMKTKILEPLLDALQHGMIKREYGISKQVFDEWFGKGKTISKFWYDDGSHYSKKLSSPEFLLLTHDWSKDILFINNPEALSKLQEAQKTAQKKIKNKDDPNQVVREFILNSGLLDITAQSVGAGHLIKDLRQTTP